MIAVEGNVLFARIPPGQRIAWLLSKLAEAGFPVDTRPDPETGGIKIRTVVAARPIVEEVLGYQAKGRQSWRKFRLPHLGFGSLLLIALVLLVVVGYYLGVDLWLMDLWEQYAPQPTRPTVEPPSGFSLPNFVLAPFQQAQESMVEKAIESVQATLLAWCVMPMAGIALVVTLMFALVIFGRRRL